MENCKAKSTDSTAKRQIQESDTLGSCEKLPSQISLKTMQQNQNTTTNLPPIPKFRTPASTQSEYAPASVPAWTPVNVPEKSNPHHESDIEIIEKRESSSTPASNLHRQDAHSPHDQIIQIQKKSEKRSMGHALDQMPNLTNVSASIDPHKARSGLQRPVAAVPQPPASNFQQQIRHSSTQGGPGPSMPSSFFPETHLQAPRNVSTDFDVAPINLHPPPATLPPPEPVGQSAQPSPAPQQELQIQDFLYRLRYLWRVQRSTMPKNSMQKGPLVVVEGFTFNATQAIGAFLYQEMSKEREFMVRLLDGAQVTHSVVSAPLGEGRMGLADYHRLTATWLVKSNEVERYLQTGKDPTPVPQSHARASTSGAPCAPAARGVMAIDHAKSPSILATTKPVCIITNYTLYSVDFCSHHMALQEGDAFGGDFKDHWTNLASSCRGVLGPDLVIYVHDSPNRRDAIVPTRVEGTKIIVFRSPTPFNPGDRLDSHISPAALRRLRFEVAEFIREF